MTSQTRTVTIIEEQEYLAQIRDLFIRRKCTKDHLSAQDRNLIQGWFRAGISFEAIKAAIFLGCCRKYRSWLENPNRSRINSLGYFAPLLKEVGEGYKSGYYRLYLESKISEFEEDVE